MIAFIVVLLSHYDHYIFRKCRGHVYFVIFRQIFAIKEYFQHIYNTFCCPLVLVKKLRNAQMLWLSGECLSEIFQFLSKKLSKSKLIIKPPPVRSIYLFCRADSNHLLQKVQQVADSNRHAKIQYFNK